MRTLLAVSVVTCLVASAEEGPAPKLINGKPLIGFAVIDGPVAVTAFDDGEWVDPSDLRAVEASTLIIDLKAKPVDIGEAWAQPVKASYRGGEGWQSLRWGMTPSDVKAAMKRAPNAKPEAPATVAFKTQVDDRPAAVHCLFAMGRLSGVAIVVPGSSLERLKSLLEDKYGVGEEEEFMRTRWTTPETTIALFRSGLSPTIMYGSKVFGVFMYKQLKDADRKQADSEL